MEMLDSPDEISRKTGVSDTEIDVEIAALERTLAEPAAPAPTVTVKTVTSMTTVTSRPIGTAVVDLLVEFAGYAAVIACTILAFITMYWHIGDFDAGAPAFIAIGDKLLMLVGTLVGTAVGGLIAFLMRRALADYRRRTR